MLKVAKRRRLCENVARDAALNLMSPREKHPGLRRSNVCAALAALLMISSAAVCFAPLFAADPPLANTNWLVEATNHLGLWIWDTNTFDKQTCRLWKSFQLPPGAKPLSATLRITVDNGYSLFWDGREIGRGSDWRTVTKYDVTQLLNPGPHQLAVEGFNDRLEAGLMFGLHIEFQNRPDLDLLSDESWFIVPETQKSWTTRQRPAAGWHPAMVIGPIHRHPWEVWPYGLTTGPPLVPLVVHFWQTGWFQLSLLTLLLLAVAGCAWLQAQLSLHARARRLLEDERIRIARDIHDDLGAQLTQLVLLGEVARREQPDKSSAQAQFNQICALARELSHGMDEVVWAVNARRDTLRDFTSYVCKYAQLFLNPTPIRCRLDVESDLPVIAFDLPVRRNLFLAVKEALNNAAKYSGAAELFLRIHRAGERLVVAVEDDGRGFAPSPSGGDRHGLVNMHERLEKIGGTCELFSAPGAGCRVVFTVPLISSESRGWLPWLRQPSPPKKSELER